jgi:hypothetical protein
MMLPMGVPATRMVRLQRDAADAAAVIARARGESASSWMARVIREAVAREDGIGALSLEVPAVAGVGDGRRRDA